jgi:hypothetical protein
MHDSHFITGQYHSFFKAVKPGAEGENGMKILIGVLVLLLFAGCASFTEKHSRTVLMDRSTGERQECTVAMVRSAAAYEEYKECIRSYEAQGYSIFGQY